MLHLCAEFIVYLLLFILLLGPRVLDDVLSPLLSDLSSPSSQRSEVALDGLRQVMAVKSRVVLPHLVPQLIQPPVNIRALALLTSVAGECGDTLPHLSF